MTTAAVLQIAVRANTAQANAALASTDAKLKQTAATARATTAKTSAAATAAGAGIARGMKAGVLAIGAVGAGSIVAAAKFESSFADVRKTVDASEKQFGKLEVGLREMAKTIPVSVTELSELAGQAGALGIKSKDLLKFTKTAAELGISTDLSADQAANALARLSNIMGTSSKDFRRLGSTMVELGNKGASTESEIAEMALRIAGAGKQVGLTEDEVLSFSSALSSVGVRAEAGGSAISRAFITVAEAVDKGGKDLANFAEVADMSTGAFAKMFEQDAAGAMIAFTEGLGKIKKEGGSVFATLEELELDEIRVRDALLRAAGAGDLFSKALKTGSDEWKRNNALTTEAERRYATTVSQFQVLKNRMFDVGITIGEKLLPKVNELMGVLGDPDISIGDKLSAVMKTLAEEGAKLGGKLAVAFGKAFLDTSIWGKLFMGAALVRIFGGAGIFGRALGGLGKGVGMKLAGGIFLGLAAGIEVWNTSGGLKDFFSGKGSPEIVGEKIGASIGEAMSGKVSEAVASNNLPALRNMRQKFEATAKWMEEAGIEGSEAFRELGASVGDAEAKVANKVADMRQSIHELRVGFHGNIGSITEDTEKNMERIKNTLGTKSKQGQRLLNQNFQAAIESIRKAFTQGGKLTEKGMEHILDVLRSQLQVFGIKGADAEKIIQAQRTGDPRSLQRGGALTGGAASGDSIPALLERGEYVLNRKAVKDVGVDRLNDLNFNHASRFAAGGIVPAPGFPGESINSKVLGAFQSLVKRFNLFLTDAYGPGHASSEHTQYGTAIDVIPGAGGSWAQVGQAVAYAVKAGFNPVYYDGSSGSINLPPHGPGHHAHITLLTAAELLSGKSAGSQGMGALNLKLPRFIGKFVQGEAGAAGLNNSAAALEKIMGKRAAMFGGAHGPINAPGGLYDKRALMSLWSSTGGNGNAALMAAIALAESGGNPSVTNSIGARGLWQIMPYTAADFGFSYGAMTNPAMNAKAAHAILAGQGLGAWEAYTNGAYQQFMQKGGMVEPYVGSFASGGTVSKDGVAKVHKGEHISPAERKEWDKLIHQQLVELKKLAEADHRLKKQARGVLREQGASWLMDSLGGYIADVGVRSSRYAGNGKLTNIGGRR